MRKGDQEQNNQRSHTSAQAQDSPQHQVRTHAANNQNSKEKRTPQRQSFESQNQQQKEGLNQPPQIQAPEDQNVIEVDAKMRQGSDAIRLNNFKNVTNKPVHPPPSLENPFLMQSSKRGRGQEPSPKQQELLSDSQQQEEEAQPQFSTDPDQNQNPLMPNNASNGHSVPLSNHPPTHPEHDSSPHNQNNGGSSNGGATHPTANANAKNLQLNLSSLNSQQQQLKQQPALVTQKGRQLLGNHDLDLGLQKRRQNPHSQSDNKGSVISQAQSQPPRSSFKNQRQSQDAGSSDTKSIRDKLNSSARAVEVQLTHFQRNPTMKIHKNQNMASIGGNAPKLSQQRTINLNFFDDLQIGSETQSIQNVNTLDQNSISAINQGGRPQDWFHDPNFSVIYKNPKGSEFMDNGDQEDEQMYESRILETPQILDSARHQPQVNSQTPNNQIANLKSQVHNQERIKSHQQARSRHPLHSSVPPLSEERAVEQFKDKGRSGKPPGTQESSRPPKHMAPSEMELYQMQIQLTSGHGFVEDYHPNSELDIGGIHQRSHSSKAMNQQLDFEEMAGDFNTVSKETEKDGLLPNLKQPFNKVQSLQLNDEHLLKPQTQERRRKKGNNSHSKIEVAHQLSREETNQAKLNDIFMGRNLDMSIFKVHKELDESDIVKKVANDFNEKPQLDDKRARMMILGKLQDARAKEEGAKNDFLMVVEKLPIERVDDIEGSCVRLRKLASLLRINLSSLCFFIIKSKIFEAISLMVIIANSVFLAIEDPTSTTSPAYQSFLDTMFLTLYTMEMSFKILGLGFLFNRGAYLRDPWNALDFLIVVTAYIPLVINSGGVNLSGLRAFRVLRPLKSISSIEGLKVIVSALLSSLPLLRDTIIVLIFFFFIFAIAGLQLFSGYLKNRCVVIDTGLPDASDGFCGYIDCNPGQFCGKQMADMNFDQTNFNNIFYSLMNVFTSVTMEGWTGIMYAISQSFTNLSIIYFVPLVFIGGFFLMNLTLAVIQSKFTAMHEAKAKEKSMGKIHKKVQELDFVTYDHLDDAGQSKKKQAELEVRNKIIRKWRMILFIKERIRNNIKLYKQRKANPNNDTSHNNRGNRTNTVSTALENGPSGNGLDYGQFFIGSPLGNNPDLKQVNESNLNNSQVLDVETQQSHRMLMTSSQSFHSRNLLQQEIHLAPLSNEERFVKQQSQPRLTAGGTQNFRMLEQEAIAEDDDEYKTELSNIIASNKHFGAKHKNKRGESNGSRSTPKSAAGNDDIRRSSSRSSNFQNQIQFLQNMYSQQPKAPMTSQIAISSPGKSVKLLGMQSLKRRGESTNSDRPLLVKKDTSEMALLQKSPTSKKVSNPGSQRMMAKKNSNQPHSLIDDQFFQDFISHDLEVLEQVYSEKQLLDIADRLEHPDAELLNAFGNSHLLLNEAGEEELDRMGPQFSEISIVTDDFNSRNPQIYPNQRNNDDDQDDKNTSPYTTTTGLFAKSGNNYHRQRSKNTNNFFMSQDLSISQDDEYDSSRTGEQLRMGSGRHRDGAGKDLQSPVTQQSMSNEGGLTQGDIVPLARQGTDTETLKSKPIELKGEGKAAARRGGESTATHNMNGNLSHSNITAYNHNGTIHSEVGKSSKDQGKYRTMGSSKVIPFDSTPFIDPNHQSIRRRKFGAGTINNADEIPLEQSVLNSRFLISEYLQRHQKIYLIKEMFDFQTQTNDIFEQREARHKEEVRTQKMIDATNYNRSPIVGGRLAFLRRRIQPYQRKVFYQQKVYKASDDQQEYLQHLGLDGSDLLFLIREQFNEPYITNIYVTGTLSIAIHDRRDEDLKTNRTRRIQNIAFKPDKQVDLDDSLNQSMSMIQANPGVTNNSINASQLLKRFKTGQSAKTKSVMQILPPDQQLAQDIKTTVFTQATQNRVLSKSLKQTTTTSKQIRSQLKKLNKESVNQTTGMIDSSVKRQLLLQKAAAKDPQLQRKLILSGINRDAFRSTIFRPVITKRKNRLTPEEIEVSPCIAGMLDIYEDEEEKAEKDDEEEESSSEDEADIVRDDFIDWPMDCKTEILKAKKNALASKKNAVQWSGQDVLTDFDPDNYMLCLGKLNFARIWPKDSYGLWKQIQVPIKRFVKGGLFDNFMTTAVFINTIALAMDRYGIDSSTQADLTTMNTIFTWIFIFELGSKLVGLGPIKYFKDRMNYLDCIVVVLSIVEMAFSGSSNLSAFRSIRIFRTFRVLRVARLLRSMKSMQAILGVLVRSMDSFIYLAMLLMLFVFIYSLLGMQLYGGNFNFTGNYSDPPGIPRTNFNNFNSAFFTVFQILTLENWPNLLYDALRCGVSKPITIVYFISWVFLGNFMLLNLFLAILLDSFTQESPSKKEDSGLNDKQKWKFHLEELEDMEGQPLIEYYQETKDQGNGEQKGGLGGAKKKKKKKKDENILDESFEYTPEVLAMKLTTKKKKVDFDGVECEVSMYFLPKRNRLRLYLYRMVTHNAFETVILILIVLSSIKLVIDSYIFGRPDTDPIAIASNRADYFFTAVFASESMFKSLAFGFIQDRGSYLRETWSQLDFFIVVTSLIDASFESVNLPIIKILRLLRTLRPLRFISHNSGMKTIVVALIGSVSGIVNVLIVVFVVWMMFGILAVNFFGGKLQYCTVGEYIHSTKAECLRNRGMWKTRDYNFDNLGNAMITLFALATLEDWPDTMYNTIYATGIERGPQVNSSPPNGYFFVVYILIGSYLFLNLFVGVIFKEFVEAQEEEKASLMLRDNQIRWVDMMKMISNSNPDFETTNKPKQKYRAMVHSFMTGDSGKKINWVDIFVMVCIVLNMFQMAINYEGSSENYQKALEYINYFFTGIFGLECLLKLFAFGGSYFKTGWNMFDFCVVVASFFDIVMNQLSTSSLKFLRVGPQLARVMRVMRVSRLFRLINKYKGLQALIQTIMFSLPSLASVFSLLLLAYFIFAVLGNFLFRGITEGLMVDEFTNFNNFQNAFMTVIRMSTGEDWVYIMFDCMRGPADDCIPGRTCGIAYAPVYYIPFIMVIQQIILNLFIMVIIQQFELYYLTDDNVLEKFKDQLIIFKKTWTDFTQDHDCLKLKDTKLVQFFRAMEPPLGMSDLKEKDIIKHVVLMELKSDEEGFVYFHELLYRSMRRVYGEAHVRNKILVEHEIRTLQKIEALKNKVKKQSWRLERQSAAQVNPFMLQMYMNISFKAWLNQYRLNLDKRTKEQEYLKENTNMDNFDLMSEVSELDLDPEKARSQKDMDEWEYLTEENILCSEGEESYYEYDDASSSYKQDEEEEDEEVDSSRMLKHQQQVDEETVYKNQNKLQGILKHHAVSSGTSQQDSSRLYDKDLIPNRSIIIQGEEAPEVRSERQLSSRQKLRAESPKDYHHHNKDNGGVVKTGESQPRLPERLQDAPSQIEVAQAKRNSKGGLQVEIPKKRTSTSQQPQPNAIKNSSPDQSKSSINNGLTPAPIRGNALEGQFTGLSNVNSEIQSKAAQFKFDLKLTDNFLANSHRPEDNDNEEDANVKGRMSLDSQANGGRGGAYKRKMENVIVSSRSGSNMDQDGLDSPRNGTPDNALQPDDGNDRIVLLKISMESSSGVIQNPRNANQGIQITDQMPAPQRKQPENGGRLREQL